MGPMILFTHLKIILLQCFQFSVSATISSIQTDTYVIYRPYPKELLVAEKKKGNIYYEYVEF